ncbi:MAG: hypothetical protein RIS70_2286 [Planctomycetota bacterium]
MRAYLVNRSRAESFLRKRRFFNSIGSLMAAPQKPARRTDRTRLYGIAITQSWRFNWRQKLWAAEMPAQTIRKPLTPCMATRTTV